MRALLVVNPAATTTSARTRDVLAHALASDLKLDVAETQYRGHARDLARQAAEGGETELVVALGGDGTVNEVVNGLLTHGPDPEALPRLAVVPGGSTNVFARALGLPNDVVESTGALLDALRDGSERTVGLGLASGTPGTEDEAVPARWFTFCAGFGFDAGVVGRVEQQRERGKRSTHALYVRQFVRQFLSEPNRRNGVITLEQAIESTVSADPLKPSAEAPAADAEAPESTAGRLAENLVMAIICNTAPWTYLGNRPLYPSPDASFDTGLDVFALSRLSVPAATRYATQLLTSTPERGPQGKHAVSLHDLTEFTLHSQVPLPFQMDGDHLGLRTSVTFTGVRRALRVIV
ncbi:diacylglycerol kinase family protein [Streptomyces sp. MST-110588]|uniref:diacylglycerol/lipid kinase family protein n=1 Tax=Streptomyces sp. MST-110588 TaxID=2833628 RepID=UPI001F5CB399|nr:diacylglycerol kinase family protein [Streptomyces sp. MST-110588]UNO40003.1 diacylglycerol kinase family lipid kinase [Streptomyces sp. MST-110588]